MIITRTREVTALVTQDRDFDVEAGDWEEAMLKFNNNETEALKFLVDNEYILLGNGEDCIKEITMVHEEKICVNT